MQGIECIGDGSGQREYEIMDHDYRGKVRFKDFCKFVKAHAKGIAYEEKAKVANEEKAKDSSHSISYSDIAEGVAREIWQELDP